MEAFLQALAQGLLIGSTYGLLALGMGLIYSVSGIVNFSHGDFVSLAMYLCFALFTAFSLDPYVSLIITLPLMLLVGGLVYRFIIQPVAGGHALMVVQLTLGIALVVQNGILMAFGGQPQRTPSFVEAKLVMLGDVVMRMPHVIAFFTSISLASLLFIVLRSTDIGRSIRAVHQNARAAALMGIDVDRVKIWTFATGIGLLAIAGALLSPGTPLMPTMGLRYTVITLLALVLGGMTNFLGIMVAGFVIGISEAMGMIYLSDTLGMILPYATFVLIVLFRPEGILGQSRA
ncbi:MAG: branched-chain amino acid ABC transporter permease [Phyllobacteriaceae bacterium]|nr:branched-chain amino acid ABC transporter permease [Phyllobacteriaceae bacterium]